jgi:hypothetical protein
MVEVPAEEANLLIDDGGRLYYMDAEVNRTDEELIEDFLDGYDGDITFDEIELIRI